MKIDDYVKTKRELLHKIGKYYTHKHEMKRLKTSLMLSSSSYGDDDKWDKDRLLDFFKEYEKFGGHADITLVEYPELIKSFKKVFGINPRDIEIGENASVMKRRITW